MIQLSQDTLCKLPCWIGRPTYDRTAITPGIVHIGCGNFHRAHQAWYLEQLFRQQKCFDWGIVGAGVRSADAAMRKKLSQQDWMSTLIELSSNREKVEVIGAMIDFAEVDTDNSSLIRAMAAPSTRIVALTVTEGGYYRNGSGNFDETHSDMQYDAAHPEAPRTAFGAIVAALRRRREAHTGPFTCLSCDNLQGNGDVLRRAVVSLARLSEPELADWIEERCTFPNSMVDCIVPATGPKQIELARRFGIDDAAPVAHESFRMWVMEDRFCAGRPDWSDVGAIFTDDIDGFERAKIRILNGGGQILGPAADLLGFDLVADVMRDDLLFGFFRKCETEDVLPHVPAIPGYTPTSYLDMVIERFSNTAIGDTTRRFAFDGSSKEPGFLLPSILDGLSESISIEGLALASALWCRYCLGRREDGSVIEPNDTHWADLQVVAKAAEEDPIQWLKQRHIYGDLAAQSRFTSAFARWRSLITKRGVAETIISYLQ